MARTHSPTHPPNTQEALVAYTEAQRLDPSTEEAAEQAERVRGLIAAQPTPPPPVAFAGTLPSTLPLVAEEEDEALVAAAAAAARAKAEADSKERLAQQASRMAEAATKAAVAATAAAESAAALISPGSKSAIAAAAAASGDNPGGPSVPAALALGGGEEAPTLLRKGAERDSDSMSVDLGTQSLLPVGLG